ncbi:MAG: 5-dehydro-4-deoxy-D-glucuronate isomerase [Prolixibacteraceae bacterium]|nr:5-dehydro-4-deoxy-D-glucuronate isomerase [Prolixibacteraceae bacterium]
MTIHVEQREAYNPHDFKGYDTTRIRKEFLMEKVMEKDSINLIYSQIERFVVGGAVPVTKTLSLEPIDELKANYFCERREVGIINVGGKGTVTVDGEDFIMNCKDALYIGKGAKKIDMKSDDANKPAHYYINSAPAHKSYPNKRITLQDANVLHMGALETSNERNINQLMINSVVPTCQLQMGMTELKPGSVWNTMPAHTHSRRSEFYFYFEVPEGQSVCHFMGQPQETRHIWMQNEQLVISPPWSIHSAAGTSNYIFIWGMGGENLDYNDMDVVKIPDLK